MGWSIFNDLLFLRFGWDKRVSHGRASEALRTTPNACRSTPPRKLNYVQTNFDTIYVTYWPRLRVGSRARLEPHCSPAVSHWAILVATLFIYRIKSCTFMVLDMHAAPWKYFASITVDRVQAGSRFSRELDFVHRFPLRPWFLLLSGMFMSGQWWSSCCILSDGKRINPMFLRPCLLWSTEPLGEAKIAVPLPKLKKQRFSLWPLASSCEGFSGGVPADAHRKARSYRRTKRGIARWAMVRYGRCTVTRFAPTIAFLTDGRAPLNREATQHFCSPILCV